MNQSAKPLPRARIVGAAVSAPISAPPPSPSPLSPPLPSAPISVAARAADHPFDLTGKSVFLVGIGGCGMSGLARLMRCLGAAITGLDRSRSETTRALEREGAVVGLDDGGARLPERCDMLVVSAAVPPDHPVLLEAQSRGVPHFTYAEALGRCMGEGAFSGVCVAGTHGKSTTTAMLGCALRDAALDPTVIVGAECPQLGGGFRLGAKTIPAGPLGGQPGLLLAEACEFNRSFHNYRPRIAAITSVEADHLDVYGSLDAVVEAFREFARLLPGADDPRGPGTLLIAHEGAHRREITAGLTCRVLTIGWSPDADYCVRYDPGTRQTGLIRRADGLLAAWLTAMPGGHNAFNAATAAALCHVVGADMDAVARSLGEFRGLNRRMHFLGERREPHWPGDPAASVRVYDDYGHHPTEVETTLRAIREHERPESRGGRLICVFQPHQHSRTRFLLDEFASAFSSADVVIVPHIYFVRDSEAEKHKVSSQDLVDRLRARGVHAMHIYPFDAIIEQLQVICRPGDVLAVMGAGPVDAVARGYLEAGAR